MFEVNEVYLRSVRLIFEVYEGWFWLTKTDFLCQWDIISIFEICEADLRSVRQDNELGLCSLWYWSQVTETDLSSVALIFVGSGINLRSDSPEVCETD